MMFCTSAEDWIQMEAYYIAWKPSMQSPLNARQWESWFTAFRIQATVFHSGAHCIFLVEKTNIKNTGNMFRCTTLSIKHALSLQHQCHALVLRHELYFGRHLLF